MTTLISILQEEKGIMDVKRLIIDLNNMFLRINFWDNGNAIAFSFKCDFFDKAYIDKNNRIRFNTKECNSGELMLNLSTRNAENDNSEFFEISRKYFNDNLANLVKDSLRHMLNGEQLIPNPSVEAAYKLKSRPKNNNHTQRCRNLNVGIYGLDPDGYNIWCPTGENLFEELEDFMEIPSGDFMDLPQDAVQLELDLF